MAEKQSAVTVTNTADQVLEQVIANGDLSKLKPHQRLIYYKHVCESLGLNPLTQPFAYIQLNNKLTLYARRDAADQLRRIHKINLSIVSRETIDDVYVVTAQATTPAGRSDESTGVVCIKGLGGDRLANAFMKAETKAKRRVTLSLVGLGWLDENEIVTVPGAQVMRVDSETGEIEAPHWGQDEKQRGSVLNRAEVLGFDRARLFAALSADCGRECQRLSDYPKGAPEALAAIEAYHDQQAPVEDDAPETEEGKLL